MIILTLSLTATGKRGCVLRVGLYEIEVTSNFISESMSPDLWSRQTRGAARDLSLEIGMVETYQYRVFFVYVG